MSAKCYVLNSDTIRQRAAAVCQSIGRQGKRPWQVEFRPYVKRRNTSQNSLLWALNTMIANETGHTPEEIHDYLKQKFLPPVVVQIGDDMKEVPGSTAKLPTVDFAGYVEQVQALAASLGLILE